MTVTPSRFHWKFKPLATVDAAGVQNTWYTVLDTTLKVRLYSLWMNQYNDEAAAKTISMQIIVDGVTLTHTLSGASNTTPSRCYEIGQQTDTLEAAPATYLIGRYVALHGKSVKVQVRSTSAAGTNQHLKAYLRYAKLEAL